MLNFYIYFDIFEAQTASCYKSHSKAPALTFYWLWLNADILILWRSPWLRIFPSLTIYEVYTFTGLHRTSHSRRGMVALT
jgi:hypothetical protein